MTRQTLPHPSVLPLDGGINFRDLGNKVLPDGSKIKPGLLFRAGALDRLSDNDLTRLTAQNLFQILDYRDSGEIADKPDRLWQGALYTNAPANPMSKEVDANLEKLGNEALTEFDPKAFMLRLYELLPLGNPAYHALGDMLRNPEKGGIVQHCAVGKDRTGVGSALVLFALGADTDMVMEDYLLTNDTLAPYRHELLAEHAKNMPEAVVEKFAYVYSVQPDFLNTALKSIHSHYGSIDTWLAKDIGLTTAVRDKIRNHFLE